MSSVSAWSVAHIFFLSCALFSASVVLRSNNFLFDLSLITGQSELAQIEGYEQGILRLLCLQCWVLEAVLMIVALMLTNNEQGRRRILLVLLAYRVLNFIMDVMVFEGFAVVQTGGYTLSAVGYYLWEASRTSLSRAETDGGGGNRTAEGKKGQ